MRKVSPEELARLVSKLNVDAAAGAEVLPHYGDFRAPGFWTPARGQTRDRRSLREQRDAGEESKVKERVRSGMKEQTTGPKG